jgi:hypothetical protein
LPNNLHVPYSSKAFQPYQEGGGGGEGEGEWFVTSQCGKTKQTKLPSLTSRMWNICDIIEWILSNFHHTSPKKMGTYKLRCQKGERLQMAQDVSNT